MAFVELPPRTNQGRTALTNVVRANVTANGVVSFRISEDIHQKLGNAPFCQVLVGTEEHKGKIALLPRSKKTVDTLVLSAVKGQRSRTLQTTGSRLGVNSKARQTTTLPHEISDHGILIDVSPLMSAPVASIFAAA